jgi:hypothetical protein
MIGRPFTATSFLSVNFLRTPENLLKYLKITYDINTIYCIFIIFLKKFNIFY